MEEAKRNEETVKDLMDSWKALNILQEIFEEDEGALKSIKYWRSIIRQQLIDAIKNDFTFFEH